MSAQALDVFKVELYLNEQWRPDIFRKAAESPVVLSVGNLHTAALGTGRDAKGDLI